MTDQPVSLPAALAALQADLPRIPRTAQGQVGTRRYRYPPYDAILRRIRPILTKHGFLWSSEPGLVVIADQIRFVLAYELTRIAAGDGKSGLFPLAEGASQQQGAQISYAKRQCLIAVLDLEVVGEDDDSMERTPAKIPGPDHERLRHGTVERTPADRPAERSRGPVDNGPVDKWTDQPSGEFDIGTPEDHPGSIDGAQLKTLQTLFRQVGIQDRAVRLGMTSDIIGRDVLTANQLSRIEADAVIRNLRERPKVQ